MLVAVICTDKPKAIEIRLANRKAHLSYIKSTGCVAQAGPFLNGDDEMCGSLIILEVDSMRAAQEWAENDPYALAGLFSNVRLETWKKVV